MGATMDASWSGWLPFHVAPGEGSPVVLHDDHRGDWSQTMRSTRPVRAVGVKPDRGERHEVS
jgi:hypothetical protein